MEKCSYFIKWCVIKLFFRPFHHIGINPPSWNIHTMQRRIVWLHIFWYLCCLSSHFMDTFSFLSFVFFFCRVFSSIQLSLSHLGLHWLRWSFIEDLFTSWNLVEETSVNFCSSIVQAAAHGLPIVATKNGGPVDIHRVCQFIGLIELVRRIHAYQSCTWKRLYHIFWNSEVLFL